jgi:acyl carrier protein
MREKNLPRVRVVVSRVFGVASTHVRPNTDLKRDLGVDSLDKIELAMQLEEEFGVAISDGDALGTNTVRDMARLVEESR